MALLSRGSPDSANPAGRATRQARRCVVWHAVAAHLLACSSGASIDSAARLRASLRLECPRRRRPLNYSPRARSLFFEEHAMTDQAAVVKTRDVTGSRYEPPQRSHQEKRWFYIGAGVFSILLAFAGFGPSLIDHSRRYAPPEALYVAHGATSTATSRRSAGATRSSRKSSSAANRCG